MGGEEMIKFKWTMVFLIGFGVLLSTSPALAEKMTVGWSAVSALNAPFWVMNDAGFLKKEGLDANLIYIPSSSTMAQAQLSGNVDVSTANSQVIVDAGLTGGDRRSDKRRCFLCVGQSEDLECRGSQRPKSWRYTFRRFHGFRRPKAVGE